jgi:small subunit ribosomal protein S1
VTNVAPFGAFVQIEEAVEGLIHASELDADPQTQPRDLLQPGQTVTAKIISLDKQRQRMGLSLRRMNGDGQPAAEAQPVAEAPPAAEVEPVVEAEPAIEAEPVEESQ